MAEKLRGSFRLGSIAGVRLRVHVTFFLVVVLFAAHWGSRHGVSGAAFGILAVLLLFACVVIHELAHSLVARAFGLPVKEILLLPIGGVSELQKEPEKPLHELLISLAGPLTNVAIAFGLALVLGASRLRVLEKDGLLQGGELAPTGEGLLLWLLAANVTLALFNMIPAFPMDGGRVLRAVLTWFVGPRRATLVAGAIGQALALALGFYAILRGHLPLALVALFVFLGAGQSVVEEETKDVLSALKVRDATNTHALVLAPGDHVSKVVDYILTSYQPDFAVVHGGELLGIVTRNDVLKTLASETRDVYVAGVMTREPLRVAADRTVADARTAMREAGTRVAAVFDGEQFLGLVSQEDIAEAFLMTSFLRRQEEARKHQDEGA